MKTRYLFVFELTEYLHLIPLQIKILENLPEFSTFNLLVYQIILPQFKMINIYYMQTDKI
jgi:hypothetical protein